MTDELRQRLIREGWTEALYGYWRTPDGSLLHWREVIAFFEKQSKRTA